MKKFYNLDPLTYKITDVLYTDSQYVDKLFGFLVSSIEPPYSLSINGSWGSGKTMLMQELKKQFEGNQYPVLWFNPWEYERTEDIVFSFLVSLNTFAKSHLADALKEIGIFGFSFLLSGLDLTARLLTKGALSYKGTKEICNEVTEAFKSRYDTENPAEIIKKDFADLTQALAKKHDQKPLIVFFDDLDRCLPEKALDLLEALKNLFVVPNASVIFISGIDTQVAKQFIISRYEGLESDFAYNYFKKVFNFTVNLPALTENNFKRLIENRLNELLESDGSIWPLSETEKDDLLLYLSKLLVDAGVKSIRQAYNIIHNCFFTLYMNPELKAKHKEYIILFTIKECNTDFFEKCFKLANKKPDGRFFAEIQSLEQKQTPFLSTLLEKLKELNGDLRNRVLLDI